MSERWSEVDHYITDLFARNPAAEAALDASRAARFPDIAVTAPHGKLLYLLAKSLNARAILEIGTLGGYSTIWLAKALPPGGKLITLEMERTHADLARTNLDRAGVGDRVDIRVAPALDTLAQLSGVNANSAAEAGVPVERAGINVEDIKTVARGCINP